MLGVGDTVTAIMTFNEEAGATPATVQFKNGTANLGSAVTATGRPFAYDGGVLNAAESAGTDDAIDLGTPTAIVGVERETLGNGYVYKVTRDFSSVRVRVDAHALLGATGQTLLGRWATSKPTTSNLSTHGTQFVGGEQGNDGNWALDYTFSSGLDIGSYFWVYPHVTRDISARRLRFGRVV